MSAKRKEYGGHVGVGRYRAGVTYATENRKEKDVNEDRRRTVTQSTAIGGVGGVAGGAGVGAALGSVIVPGLGTAIGAGVGAGIGLAVGMAGGALHGERRNKEEEERDKKRDRERARENGARESRRLLFISFILVLVFLVIVTWHSYQ